MEPEDDGYNSDDLCPWCGVRISDLWEYFAGNSEDAEFDCPSCDKPILGGTVIYHTLRKVLTTR